MIRAWVMEVDRAAGGGFASRVDNCDDAEVVLRGIRRREGREGNRLHVRLARADGDVVTAVDEVYRGGRWVPAEEARPS
ncbi:MAG: hypothetical protein U0324_44015 [Polyangiales bacterium]